MAALQAHDKRSAPGGIVLLHGLETFRRQLNGCYASVAYGSRADGRFRLRLAAGDVVDGAPENLLAVSALRTWAAMPFLRISRWRGPCMDRLASMSGTLACDPTSGFPGEPQALRPRLLLCTNAASVCDGLQRRAAAQCWRQVAFVLHA